MLNSDQKDRLQTLHSYEWVDEDDENQSKANLNELLGKIDSIEELWYTSFIIQWSPEEGDLEFFYTHPLCDKGLALFLYWALDPVDLYKINCDGELNSFQKSYWLILKKIEELYASNRYKEVIAFDPFKNGFRKKTDGIELIPEQLKQHTQGVEYDLNYNCVFG